MGNFLSSSETQEEERSKIIFDIEQTGNKLKNEYTEKFLDPDFCNRVTMIDSDDLSRFQHHTVAGRSYSFGYIGDVPQVKEVICEGITEEYTLKRQLVTLILSCFKDCNSRIDSISKGPICRGNPEAFTQKDCKPPNKWLDVVAPPDETVGKNDTWFNALNEYHDYFMKNISVLQNILDDLDNNDDNYSIDRVKEMIKTVEKVKASLNIECSKLQRHMLTIPTFTEQEVLEKEKIEQEALKKADAKRAALLGTGISI
jgi:hypothetical protein